MPPFANELDSVSSVEQQQQDLEHADGVELEREFPQYTNFLKINEHPREEVANCEQMVELLQTARILHDIRSESIGKGPGDLSICIPWTNTLGSSQDLSLEVKRSKDNLEEEKDEGEDRQELGSLLSGRLLPSPQALGRKRSLSSMLESEDLLRSSTSSESNPDDVGELDHESSANKISKTSYKFKAIASRCTIDKDLLSLSLPNSLYSECSSSSRGSDLLQPAESQQQQQPPGFESSFQSSKSQIPSIDNGSSDNPLLPEEGRNDSSNILSSSIAVTLNEDDHATAFDDLLLPTASILEDDAAGGDTRSQSFDAAKVGLTMTDPSRNQSFRGALLHPLGGLDASRLNEHSLFMLDADSRLEDHGLQLVHLLLKCADATDKDNMELAARLLGELYQAASLFGDSMQRVAAYFAEGLAARIVCKDSERYSHLMSQPSAADYFSAFTDLYKVTPYFQFAHFTANQAILEAVEGQYAVHVIDLDIMQGFQWPSLIQSFASRPDGPPHLRITGVGKDIDIVQETGRRLTSFAESFNVSFEFQCLVEENLESLTPDAFTSRVGEAVAVNSIFQFHRLLNPTTGEKFHKFVQTLCRELHPCVVTVVEQEANHNSATFLGRFMEALHYYAAVFDSLDASLPQQDEKRVKIERVFYAQQIKNIVACEGDQRIERHETLDSWLKIMHMAGFKQIPLSSYAKSQAKLLLPSHGYRLHERNGVVSLGWQERQLLTASAWSCS